MRLLQERDERAVAFAVVLQHMRRFDGAICHLVDLELLAAAKVLEDLTVIIRDCQSHKNPSFRCAEIWRHIHRCAPCGMGLRQAAGLPAAMALLRAELEIPACDLQRASFDKSPCQAAPCPRVDALHRRAGHTHLHSTFFLRHAQVIHEADALIVFDLHPHGCLGLIRLRRKARIQGHGADAPRLGHSPHTFHLNPPSIFLTYVIYCQYSEFADICQHKMRAQGCVG